MAAFASINYIIYWLMTDAFVSFLFVVVCLPRIS